VLEAISKHSTFFLFLFIRKDIIGTSYLVITRFSLCLCVLREGSKEAM